MDIAALLTWLVTAVLGFTMLGVWVNRGGLRTAAAGGGVGSRFAPGLVFGHFLLAAAGLVVWIIYLITKTAVLTWVAFVALLVVAVLGDVLFVRWWRSRSENTAESAFPRPVVYTHGLFAVATIVLVLITALDAG